MVAQLQQQLTMKINQLNMVFGALAEVKAALQVNEVQEKPKEPEKPK